MRSLAQPGLVAAMVIQVAILCSTAARAQLARQGGEFLINASTITDTLRLRRSRVAAGPGGGFVVVWDNPSGDGDGRGVFARRFDSGGEPIAGQFQVNSMTTGDQRDPRLAVAADGSFLVVWDTGPKLAVGQVFDAAGAARGPEIAIAEPEVNGPANAVAATEAGEFVVVFSDFFDGNLMRARRFNVAGEPLGASFSVSGVDYHRGQLFGTVAAGSANSFLVVWYDETVSEMHGRHFAAGAPTGPEFTVADVSSLFVGGPESCGSGTGFVVTWATYDEAPYNSVVRYRRYSQGGEPVTDPLRVTPPRQFVAHGRPAAACASDGDFVLVWPETSAGMVGRTFVADRTADFRIGFDGRPSVAMLTDDEFVVTWDECGPDGGCDVFGQRFTLTGSTQCPGDCDLNGSVTINELILAVDAALSLRPDLTRRCLAADTSLNYVISIDELVAAVNRSLRGCP